MSESNSPQKARLNIDLNKLKELGFLGIRRASAFLCFGLTPTYGEPPKTATLNSAVNFQFLPNPLPEELAHQIVAEYRTWLIGNALRELDLHSHLFFDEVWRVAQWASLNGQRVKSDHRVSEISSDTNSASKLEKIIQALDGGEDKDAVRYLRSIANARNCLTHHAGVVSARHANLDGKQLILTWLGQELRLEQGESFIQITPETSFPFQAPDPSKEAVVTIKFVEKEKRFEIGSQIILTEYELHELCFFYYWLIERVMKRVTDVFLSKGLANLSA
jgi:hypothetical protein